MKSDRICWADIKVNSTPLNGEKIVKEIEKQTGIKTTRQNISNALKNAMGSFYKYLFKSNDEMTSFQVASLMLEMLYANNIGEYLDFRGGVDSFFRLFPKKIRDEIKEDSLNYYSKRKNENIPLY